MCHQLDNRSRGKSTDPNSQKLAFSLISFLSNKNRYGSLPMSQASPSAWNALNPLGYTFVCPTSWHTFVINFADVVSMTSFRSEVEPTFIQFRSVLCLILHYLCPGACAELILMSWQNGRIWMIRWGTESCREFMAIFRAPKAGILTKRSSIHFFISCFHSENRNGFRCNCTLG
jgi:hypothetical protein